MCVIVIVFLFVHANTFIRASTPHARTHTKERVATPHEMPPGVGALTEGDGRNFMLLMDMSRFLVNEICQEHDFQDVSDAAKLRSERMDLAAGLIAKMWSYWHSAPAGRGVYEMQLDWCKQQHSSGTNLRHGSSVHGSRC